MTQLFLRSIVGLVTATKIAVAAIPAAWEPFPSLTNATAWRVFDYSDGFAYFPEWDDSEMGLEFIWLRHNGDEPLEFSADAGVANGALIGNYAVANVREISCEVFIEALSDFDKIDCSILTKGGDGVERWYYSIPYTKDDFLGNGWWTVRFGMKEPWSYFTGTATVSVIPDTTFMASIKEVSVTFFPRQGVTANRKAAIDNFILEPDLIVPPLATAVTRESFLIQFTPAPGLKADLQRLTASPPFIWNTLPGNTPIIGPSPHTFTTPLDVPVKVFLVSVSPNYLPIVTAP